MATTLERVPAHLRQFVAQQDYGAYDEIDQAVWRFILIQTQARLRDTAHPAYLRGLARTGIGLERIPRIEEMDARLREYGWGAVCVDGFIPPRAFQEFQALGIMTIAGEIRSYEHLAYTPAPDIVHESAGHAPIIPDPSYRHYLQRFGEIGARAFATPHDTEQYAAIYALSELKEDPSASDADIAAAQAKLADDSERISEAALLSRLHWWTVEYGLVGTPDDYRLYGAGLLSSLGESHFCHEPSVEKRVLSASCVEVGYDITKPQPHLYVAECFDQLSDVLDEVAAGLAQRRGDAYALDAALRSREVATLSLCSGLQLTGVVADVHSEAQNPDLAILNPGFAFARAGRHLPGAGPGERPGRCACVLLPHAAAAAQHEPGEIELRLGENLRLRGQLSHSRSSPHDRDAWFVLRGATLTRGDQPLVKEDHLTVVTGGRLASAFAGPADPSFWPDSDFPQTRIPPRRPVPASYRALRGLYQQALELWKDPESPALAAGFERIAEQLRSDFPEDWLLRWNLLECLRKLDHGVVLASQLRDELLEIEARHPRDAPITMGLRHLGLAPRRPTGGNHG